MSFRIEKIEDLPPYLSKNNWEQELNFKLWVTKGARFAADKRCLDKARLSLKSMTLLSSYLIIIGITPFIIQVANKTISNKLISLLTIAVSILLLVLGLIENGKDYKLKAHLFHDCSIKISKLYNSLRSIKNLDDGAFCKTNRPIAC